MSDHQTTPAGSSHPDEGPLEVTFQEPSFVSTSISHPRLVQTDSFSIRKFLSLYHQYRKEITARALQLAVVHSTTTEPVRPVNLTFCVDPEWLKSIVELHLIPDLTDPEMITDAMLRSFLEERSSFKKTTLSLPALNTLIGKELRMNMAETSAKLRMENLFASYLSLLRRHGLKWVINSRPKTAIEHIVAAIKPKILRTKLESNLEFSHMELQNNFNSFFQHAMQVSQSFDDLDLGPQPRVPFTRPRRDVNKSSPGTYDGKSEATSGSNEPRKIRSRGRPPPPCLRPPCKKLDARHWVDECELCSEEEKHGYKAAFAAKKIRRWAVTINAQPETKGKRPNVYRHDGTGRCNDGSDDSIVSPGLAEKAALKGIGKIAAIEPTHLLVALKSGTEPQRFAFSRTWTAPRTVLHLPSGSLALANITYLIADNDLACEDLLIGRPVLRHLRVDTETLFDSNRFALNGADCSDVENPTVNAQTGYVSRLMIARLQKAQSTTGSSDNTVPPRNGRPRVNYNTARMEQDPFPDPSLLDPIDSDQHDEIEGAVTNMVEEARLNGMEESHLTTLKQILSQYIDLFRVSLSAGPPASIPPLKIDLVPEAKPIRVRLQNYSQEQRSFLQNFVEDLIRTGMAYANPTSPWASAPIKDGEAGRSVTPVGRLLFWGSWFSPANTLVEAYCIRTSSMPPGVWLAFQQSHK